MIITSVVLLVGAFALLVIGAAEGNPTMLEVSLAAAAAGALALFAGTVLSRRIAVARGVPVEAVLASRVRRSPAAQPAPAGGTGNTGAERSTPPPIDGYDDMSTTDVTRLVATGAMRDEDLSDLLVYELSHRRRREVLAAVMDVVGPEDAIADDQTEQVGYVRRRIRGGRAPSGTRPAAEALRSARQATLTEGEADDRQFARPEPGDPDVDE